MAVNPDIVRRWVNASCAAQGVPVKVDDAAALEAAARLLATSKNARTATASTQA